MLTCSKKNTLFYSQVAFNYVEKLSIFKFLINYCTIAITKIDFIEAKYLDNFTYEETEKSSHVGGSLI